MLLGDDNMMNVDAETMIDDDNRLLSRAVALVVVVAVVVAAARERDVVFEYCIRSITSKNSPVAHRRRQPQRKFHFFSHFAILIFLQGNTKN
jgi:heme A synthase